MLYVEFVLSVVLVFYKRCCNDEVYSVDNESCRDENAKVRKCVM